MAKARIRIFQSTDTSIIGMMENTLKRNWDRPCVTNYGTDESYTYGDVAKMIARLHQLFHQLNIEPGNKIAICDKNNAHWAISFFAAFSYGAVVVPILSEFNIEQIQNIYEHSESSLLICGEKYVKGLKARILNIADFTMHDEPHAIDMTAFTDLQPSQVSYFRESPDGLALLSYTSGSTGRSKGVMLPYRSIWSNCHFADEVLDFKPGDHTLSILPLAHMYGFAYDFFFAFCIGCHIHFLTKTPSPHVVIKAFQDIKPVVVIVVPLILEKIVQAPVPGIGIATKANIPHPAYTPHQGSHSHPHPQEGGLSADPQQALLLPRWELLRVHHRRCSLQQGGGRLPAPDPIPLHGRLRHDGVRTHHWLRRQA